MELTITKRSLNDHESQASWAFQMGKAFWGVGSAAAEQSGRKANMVARGGGKYGSWNWLPESFQTKKMNY